jgi:hypothetical protein
MAAQLCGYALCLLDSTVSLPVRSTFRPSAHDTCEFSMSFLSRPPNRVSLVAALVPPPHCCDGGHRRNHRVVGTYLEREE